MKEADLKQQILTKHLVPDNLDQVKKLSDFVHGNLKNQRKQKDLNMDARFEKIQSENACVIGPLSKSQMLVRGT